MAYDDAVWISRGLWSRPDWAEWVWKTRHLGVGYRPVAALSYTMDAAVAGLTMPVYRCTDLALHVAAGILVFVLFRRLARDAAGWTSLLAAAVFLLHPATEEVVPFLARRSYGLGTVFALGALIAFHEVFREDRGTGKTRASIGVRGDPPGARRALERDRRVRPPHGRRRDVARCGRAPSRWEGLGLSRCPYRWRRSRRSCWPGRTSSPESAGTRAPARAPRDPRPCCWR